MRKPGMLLSVVVMFAAQLACGSTQGPGPASPSDRAVRASGSRMSNVLTAEEIRASMHTDLYDMIRALRPHWLTPRGQASMSVTQLEIFMDGTEMPGIDALRTLTPAQIERAEYLSASEATIRLGMQQGSGAILLTARRSGR